VSEEGHGELEDEAEYGCEANRHHVEGQTFYGFFGWECESAGQYASEPEEDLEHCADDADSESEQCEVGDLRVL